MTSAADLQLFAATVSGNAKNAEVAIADGADVNSRYAENLTPLHYAARSGDQATVDLLIASGAHAISQNDDGHTPSDLARLSGHHQIATRLDAAAKQQGHPVDNTLGEFFLGSDAIKEDEQGHAGRVTGERKDKGPRQPGG